MKKLLWIIVLIIVVVILFFVFGNKTLINGPQPEDNVTSEGADLQDIVAPSLTTSEVAPTVETEPVDQGIPDASAPAVVPAIVTPEADSGPGAVPEMPATPEKVTVTYNGSSFSPGTLTVPVGTTVEFISSDNDPMWVASNVHPTHEIFPDFDQLGTGDSYSFKFDDKGNYTYHNHVNPSAKGIIITE